MDSKTQPYTLRKNLTLAWRDELALRLFRIVTFVSLPAFAAAAWYAVDDGQLVLLPIYVAMILAMLVLSYWSKATASARMAGLLVVTYSIVLLNYITEGRGSLARVFLLLFSFVAVLFFGRRGAIFALIVTFLTMAFFAYAYTGGLLPDYAVSSTILSGWISNTVIMVAISSLVVFSIDYVLRGLIEALTQSQIMSATLHGQQEDLEKIVRERTAAAEAARIEAESARQEAEAARHAIEAQMWVTVGQAQLAEKMRGEQDIQILADKIIGQLCLYLKAQAGTLFLRSADGTFLRLTGSYALEKHAAAQVEFKVGEGLIGQVAAEGRARLIMRPDQAPLISSPLIEFSPACVLIAPFAENGAVTGVIELASMSAFTPADGEFLAQVSESISVAFQTVRARQSLDEALRATRLQAEELQAQEEELRAANEELQAQAEGLKALRNRPAGN